MTTRCQCAIAEAAACLLAASRLPGSKPLAGNHLQFFAPAPDSSTKTAVRSMSLAVLSALQR